MFEKIEKTAIILIVIATVLMSLEVGIGGVLLNLSISAIVLVYFYSGLALKSSTPPFLKKMALDEKGNSLVVPNPVFGYAWSIGVIGVLFIIQGFPGSPMMLYVGMIGAILGVGYSFFQNRDKTIEVLRPFFFRIFIITGIIGMFAITPKKEIQDFFHPGFTQTVTVEDSNE